MHIVFGELVPKSIVIRKSESQLSLYLSDDSIPIMFSDHLSG